MNDSRLQEARRTAVIVLGMHRSGTSAVAGVLALLGIRPPHHLMASTKDNPKGYWESTRIMSVHDRILKSAGSSWNDWGRFNPDWFESPDAQSFGAELQEVIQSEFGDSPTILVKDPRMCRLMPLWRQVLGRMGIETRVVMPLRKPSEVSASLKLRDGFGTIHGQALWLRHVLEAEAGSRDIVRSTITYEELLHDWRAVVAKVAKDLDLKWPRMSGLVEAEVDSYLTDELHRNRSMDDAARRTGRPQDEWVSEAYELLVGEPGPEAADVRARLDAIRCRFDGVCDSYMPVVHEIQNRLETGRAEFAAQLASLRGELDRAYADRTQAIEEVGRLRTEINRLCESRNAELNAHIVAHKQYVSELSGQLESIRKAHDSELGAQQEIYEIKLAELESRLVAQRKDFESRHAEIGAALAKEREGAEKLQAELDRERSRSLEFEAELRRAVEESAEAARRHASEIEAERASCQKELDRLHAKLAEADASIRARFEETKTLTELVLSLEEKVSELQSQAETAKLRLKNAAERGRLLEGRLSEAAQAHAIEIAALRAAIETHRETIERYNHWGNRILSSTTLRIARTLRGAPREMLVPNLSNAADLSEVQLLRSSRLLDRVWYLARYPDVKRRKVDPVTHYLRHGASEGRDPGPAFSTRGYLNRYPDVAASGQNPLVHYLRHGLQEGRKALPDEGTTKK